MALTSCRECSGRVAETAKVCPHCGVSDPDRTTHLWDVLGGVVWGVVKIAVLFFIVYWIVS